MSKRLQDHVALVVGASSGMGLATARLLAAEGARLALAARSVDRLESLAAELGPPALACPVDVEDAAAVARMVGRVVDHFGRLDLLVYTAGTNIPQRSLEVLTPETWESMIGANLSGAFYCTRAVLPPMRAQQAGLIIYVSSAAVQRPDVSGVSYQASKHGVVGLAHGTFREERDRGIRTCVIFPGLTDTPLVLKRPTPTPPEVMAKALKPEDVAEACLFVAALPPRTYVPELVLMPAGLA
ncbi:MAG: SDR family oxidoreductase [Candidatus Handelsmanbacteria bacterium]|nr:SDR family oxidoreductase [Candidatus Handelsmanbacteria bacterium]